SHLAPAPHPSPKAEKTDLAAVHPSAPDKFARISRQQTVAHPVVSRTGDEQPIAEAEISPDVAEAVTKRQNVPPPTSFDPGRGEAIPRRTGVAIRVSTEFQSPVTVRAQTALTPAPGIDAANAPVREAPVTPLQLVKNWFGAAASLGSRKLWAPPPPTNGEMPIRVALSSPSISAALSVSE